MGFLAFLVSLNLESQSVTNGLKLTFTSQQKMLLSRLLFSLF